jgi:hypothetical protein
MRRGGLLAIALLVAGINEGVSQTCLGLPSFARGPVNIRGAVATGNDVVSFGGGIQAGGPSVFAGGGVDYLSYSDFDESAIGVSANVGTQIPFGAGRRSSFCPVIEASLGFGPDFDFLGDDYEIRSRSVLIGLAVGTNIDAGESVRVVPNILGGLGYGGTKIEVNGAELASGTDTYGVVRAGLGFLFSGTFGLTPFVTVPLGVDGLDPSFGIWLSLALGGRQ